MEKETLYMQAEVAGETGVANQRKISLQYTSPYKEVVFDIWNWISKFDIFWISILNDSLKYRTKI